MIICVLERILHKKKEIFIQLQVSSFLPFLLAAALCSVTKWSDSGIVKCIFGPLHNEIKCVLSIKESNFNETNGSTFSHLLMVRAEGAE